MTNIAYFYEPQEGNYFLRAKSLLSGHNVAGVPIPKGIYLGPVVRKLVENNIKLVFFSSPTLLALLLDKVQVESKYMDSRKSEGEKYQPYWGSTFQCGDIEFCCMPSLESLYKRPYGEWLFRRYIDKMLQKDGAITSPTLDWELVDGNRYSWTEIKKKIEKFNSSLLVSVDIETAPFRVTEEFYNSKLGHGLVAKVKTKRKTDPVEYVLNYITCVGYCGLFQNEDGSFYSETIVIPMEGQTNYNFMREMNRTEAPKVMQNGKYDIAYFLKYDAPLHNWRYDTFGLMHSWLVELPRSLDFISSIALRNHMYWKDESNANLYLYNAKDCHATLWSCVYLLQTLPKYAKENFKENFLQIFPAVTCNMEGFAVDYSEFEHKKALREKEVQEYQEELDLIFGKGFNANSSKQVIKILQLFGMPGANSSDALAQKKFADLGTWQEVLIGKVQRYRKASKDLSTYYNFPFLGDRLLFDLDPFKTETCRYASKASSFWVGQQIQNFPEYSRSPYVADPGYTLSAADNAQSESRCTAYMSEDLTLMDAVETAPDFHRRNASLFFGIPEDKITDAIRKLSKRVNHGANYNMGPSKLVETMGTKNILAAGRLLDLPNTWGPLKLAEYLLGVFDKTYPDIRGKYYNEVIHEIKTTGMLVGATGWTRRTFLQPWDSKVHLNSAVAHGPQSLSVKIINRAFFAAWYKFQFKQELVRFKAQKHDEIIWQTLPENDWVAEEISKIMAEPTQVRGRTMVLPNDLHTGKRNWAEI